MTLASAWWTHDPQSLTLCSVLCLVVVQVVLVCCCYDLVDVVYLDTLLQHRLVISLPACLHDSVQFSNLVVNSALVLLVAWWHAIKDGLMPGCTRVFLGGITPCCLSLGLPRCQV